MAATLASKLQLKPGTHLRVTNAPGGALERLRLQLPGIVVSAGTAQPQPTPDAPRESASDPVPGIAASLVFVANYDEAVRIAAAALASAVPESVVWIAYPKGTSGIRTDVNRDILWKALERTSWRPVRQIALDDVWSAMRFRPRSMVGKASGPPPNLDAAPSRP